ncbi:MAG: hypothetical protein ACOCW5_03675, partial [Spirochaetia bacterium]
MSPLVLVPHPRVLELGNSSFPLSPAQRQAIEAFTLDSPLPQGFNFTLIESAAPAAHAVGTEGDIESE